MKHMEEAGEMVYNFDMTYSEYQKVAPIHPLNNDCGMAFPLLLQILLSGRSNFDIGVHNAP